jgi:hypothetical protein
MSKGRFILVAAVFSCAAMAQKWEVGVGGGGDFYTSQTVQGAVSSADASLTTAIAASAWLGNDSGRLLGGELRYDFEDSSLKLSSGGTTATFAGQTDAVHYDFLLHFTPRGSRIRPFVAAGAGIKLYRGTGAQSAYQSPLQDVAVFTQTKDLTPLVSAGAGVKIAITNNIQLRVEVHDYLTPFPTKVITPASGAHVSGWLQDFVPMFGLSFTF